jgi:hypothetical protein
MMNENFHEFREYLRQEKNFLDARQESSGCYGATTA